ncbi:MULTISPECIES: MATE family efflux transporter [Clostridium]|uniref:MATE family efflux transporter n=1 Tax=Clostridium TaxID=1485 RepID=UPI0008240B62|nr:MULTISPECIES: MATE family efflux transporter [Clostridium]PJI09782.1 MATE family efflux transporter [Clostridium sp. CT7]
MKDLTIGNERTVILKFTLPILLGNLFQQLYNTIDSIIVGNFLGKNSLAVVSDCFNINFAIFLIIIGLTLGTNILTAKFYGEKNIAKVKQAIDTSYVFILITSILITILGIIFSKYILIFFKVPYTLMNEANLFFKILMLGTIGSFGYNTISSILRGIGDSKTPLYFLILSTAANIFLDILFIVIFKSKSYGAAFATIISQTISFIGIFIYFNRSYSEFKFNIKNINFSTYVFKLSLKIGLPAAIQKLFLSGGLIVNQILINSFGETSIAAFAAASKLDSFAQMPAANLGDALSVFTAQNLGANKKSRVKKGFISTFIIGFIICLIISVIVVIFSKNLMRLFVKDTSVISIGKNYLLIVGSFYIAYSAMNVTNGVLLGRGDSISAMISTIVSLWCIQLPISIFMSYKIGVSGIWLGIPAGWVSGFALRLLFYFKGETKNSREHKVP